MKPLAKNLDLLQLEKQILQYWKKKVIYNQIKSKEKGKDVWRFIDGPPYTTGSIHLGTAWNKILKDYLIRYKRMRGFKVTDTPGYDTHGLPIEVQMEKELGIQNKQEIYEYGVDKFIQNCKEFAQKNLKIMNKQFKRLGCSFWDWDNPYITFKNSYIEGIWWTLKKAWERGLLYQFYRPLNCCPRCATALAKHEQEYKNVIDTSLFLKIKAKDMENTYFIIWTTTPWTLVANTAIMVNPMEKYAKVYIKDLDEYWILSRNAVTVFISGQLDYKYQVGDILYGEELEGQRYIHPLIEEVPYQKELSKQSEKAHSIILSDKYVSAEEGVGLVHTAPGHGPEDFEVGIENNLPIFNPVSIRGIYKDEAGQFEGQFVFDANEHILKILEEKGTLIVTSEIEHEYAHCWRCDSKLVYRATRQWFFKTESLVPKLLEKNEEIYWVPDWAGERWFKSWLTTLKDWCISRQRFWGIPLSVWICDNEDCNDITVIGSGVELKEIAGECPEDLHRPWIDAVMWQCKNCNKGTKRRIKDILDVWLDSGSVMWAAQEVYDGHNHYDSWIPADFIMEGKDQIRGWFNSLLCSAMVSSDRKNYNSCYMHGWVLRNNEKMSKSKGNFFEPEDLINGTLEDLKKNKSYSRIKGIETFRYYSLGATQPGRDLNFNVKEYADTFRTINTIWNVYLYANQKFRLSDFKPSKHAYDINALNKTDLWLLSKLNSTINTITILADEYKLPWITEALHDFIVNDISRWYILLIREKIDVYSEDPSKFQVMALLYKVLFDVLLLLAPINPMISEHIYLYMFKSHLDAFNLEEKDSIHLLDWPDVNRDLIAEDLEKQMEFSKELIEVARSLKNQNHIRLRWPNKKLIIESTEKLPELEFTETIKQLVNVKALEIVDSFTPDNNFVSIESKYGKVFLDLRVDDEILSERIVNDLIRNIQYSRKKNQFNVGEEISLDICVNADFLKQYVEQQKELISDKVSAKDLNIGVPEIKENENIVSERLNICPNPKCCASLKANIIKKLDTGKDVQCPYCSMSLSKNNIKTISFGFERAS
ncbi:MAG: Isoleucine--tRNA ligase [Promethearchaeota archaeon]|nr:MAG: Isoleucine--tRNA ligase [Candidatus Lokiarchaeota archaeon]